MRAYTTRLGLLGALISVLAACASEPPPPASTDTVQTAPGTSLFQMVAERPVEEGIEVVQTIRPRPGVTVRFLLSRPRNPEAAVILLAGGKGVLDIDVSGGLGQPSSNFLVRSRRLFERAGLITATLDAPSDHKGRDGMRNGFRGTVEHARDIGAVIRYLRARFGKPVWIVGTSRGTVSAVNAATKLETASAARPDGLVLSATVTKGANKGLQVMRFDLPSITQPVLLVHHRDDECNVSPFSRIKRLKRKLKRAAKREILTYTGGFNDGKPCRGGSHHGFRGIEPEVVRDIAVWIGATS